MAIRLEKAGWSTAETWLRLQVRHDLWQESGAPGRSR
jgi:plasmid maintenance system antidote protein VapI